MLPLIMAKNLRNGSTWQGEPVQSQCRRFKQPLIRVQVVARGGGVLGNRMIALFTHLRSTTGLVKRYYLREH
jgi:hypothetical protein